MLTKQEIHQLGNREMTDELQRTRRELLRTQFDVRNGSSKEVHMVKNLRRYIARLETIAREMKMDVKAGSKPAAAKTETASAATAPAEKTVVKKAPAKKAAPKKAPAAKKTAAPKKSAKK